MDSQDDIDFLHEHHTNNKYLLDYRIKFKEDIKIDVLNKVCYASLKEIPLDNQISQIIISQ